MIPGKSINSITGITVREVDGTPSGSCSTLVFPNASVAISGSIATITIASFDGVYSSLSGIPSTFAPSAHNHDASAITTGTLGVARGGTGLTALGTSLQVLRTNAGATALEYATITAGIGGSTGATDNRILRSDGTGGATLQNSAVTIDDSGNVTGVVALTANGTITVNNTVSGFSTSSAPNGASPVTYGANSGVAVISSSANQVSVVGSLTVSTTVTIGGGTAIAKVLSATATLDFPSISSSDTHTLTMTVTGAVAGDSVFLGCAAALEAGLIAFALVTAADTITIRMHNSSGGSVNPASNTFRATVFRF